MDVAPVLYIYCTVHNNCIYCLYHIAALASLGYAQMRGPGTGLWSNGQADCNFEKSGWSTFIQRWLLWLWNWVGGSEITNAPAQMLIVDWPEGSHFGLMNFGTPSKCAKSTNSVRTCGTTCTHTWPLWQCHNQHQCAHFLYCEQAPNSGSMSEDKIISKIADAAWISIGRTFTKEVNLFQTIYAKI